MVKRRSPCYHCERLNKSKYECARSCEELAKYKERLSQYVLSRQDTPYYSIPGSERVAPCPGLE
jgi:hypothetical protein